MRDTATRVLITPDILSSAEKTITEFYESKVWEGIFPETLISDSAKFISWLKANASKGEMTEVYSTDQLSEASGCGKGAVNVVMDTIQGSATQAALVSIMGFQA